MRFNENHCWWCINYYFCNCGKKSNIDNVNKDEGYKIAKDCNRFDRGDPINIV